MNQDKDPQTAWAHREAADQEARAIQQAADHKAWWLRHAASQEEEWIRQNSVTYGGLIGAGLIVVQPFLTAGSLDLTAMISVVAFAVAVPLLAALILVNRQENYRRRATSSRLVAAAKALAQLAAFVGVVAAFWHIHWITGVVILATGVVAVGVHSAGYVRLERDLNPDPLGQAGQTESS